MCIGVQGTSLWPIILKHVNYIKTNCPGKKKLCIDSTASFPGELRVLWKEIRPKIETWR